MEEIDVGTWVFANRHEGVCIGPPHAGGRLYRQFTIAHLERLVDQVDGWEQIVTCVARHIGADQTDVIACVRRALDLTKLEIVLNWWGGAGGPLSGLDGVTADEIDAIVRAEEIKAAGKVAKKDHMRRRRAEFAAVRSEMVLALLDSGVPYVCAHPGCQVIVDLTLDHKRPLSRGGTDDVSNLQFMCLPHNIQKGDR